MIRRQSVVRLAQLHARPLRRALRAAAAACWLVLVAAGPARAADAPEPSADESRASVVRVEVSRAPHDWNAPWKLLPNESLSGSAFLIGGERLLTNAHVVRDAQQVTVKRGDGSAPALATVEAIDEDCDLALLKVQNKAFLRGMSPLRLGDLPAIGSNVVTYGYPVGGPELSTTAGVVSRVENKGYRDGLAQHIAVQTDAAINPGNSGGPVMQRGTVVGVSFQILTNAQNIGFFIPAPVVRHFLDDLADGHYSGFPDFPVRYFPLSSPACRKERKLPDDRSGVLIMEVAVGSDIDGVLRSGDVLTAVDGQRVADDGTYQLGATRIPLLHLVDMKSLGQSVRFELWRDGKPVVAEWKASRFPPWDRLRKGSVTPRYLVYAGFLFVPATLEYVAALHATGPQRAAIVHDLGFRPWEAPAAEDHEMVLLAHVFSNAVNTGVDPSVPRVVQAINGRTPRNLADLARLLDAGHPRDDVFEFGPSHQIEAVDRDKARAARDTILSTYGITNDKSL